MVRSTATSIAGLVFEQDDLDRATTAALATGGAVDAAAVKASAQSAIGPLDKAVEHAR